MNFVCLDRVASNDFAALQGKHDLRLQRHFLGALRDLHARGRLGRLWLELGFGHSDDVRDRNVSDVFDAGESHHFTFVLGVPGFRPDYADVDFDAIYDADELVRHDDKSIHEALMGLPCCSSNGEGDDRDGAINVVLIGAGTELRLALLRSNWEETSDAASADSTADFFFGRRQDAIFRYPGGLNSFF